MTDRPIIFSAPMVRALLDGRKTQTRRVLKPQPGNGARGCYHRPDGRWIWVSAPRLDNGIGYDGVGLTDPFALPYATGDRLYVRESWSARMTHGWTIADARSGLYQTELLYRADGEDSIDGWWPSIHMPREFSRLTLTVTDVRVQRLQDISEADARAEGSFIGRCSCREMQKRETTPMQVAFRQTWCATHGDEFSALWNSIHGHDAWDANPWVAAITFTVQRGNIDGVRHG